VYVAQILYANEPERLLSTVFTLNTLSVLGPGYQAASVAEVVEAKGVKVEPLNFSQSKV
jgi:hypothetical protein